MTYFTDNPFEKMMSQKPKELRGDISPPAPKEKRPKKDNKKRELIIVHHKKEEKTEGNK